MKIGILTCHSTLNYGANLQLYANAKTLEKLGHEVFVYDNRDFEPGLCRSFVEQNMTLTQRCRTDEEFCAETLRLGIDTILVGSDAVLWFLPGKKEGRGAYPNQFWLRWADGLPVRKILVAGSCMGIMFLKLSRALKVSLKKDLESFDYISVRDNWTRAFLKWIGIKKVDLVFDPTSCLPEYFQPLEQHLPEELRDEKYILMTFSPGKHVEEWVETMTRLAASKGMKTCYLPHPDRPFEIDTADVSISTGLDPLQWLSILGNSSAYIGERFHPVVLSAFYGVPFMACDYYSKSGIHGLISGRSKTKDFCSRIGRLEQLVPADSFSKRWSAERVYASVLETPTAVSPVQGRAYITRLQAALETTKK